MRNLTRWIIPVFAVLAIGCADSAPEDETAETTPATEATQPAPTPPGALITAQVNGVDAGSAIAGTSTVTPTGDGGFDFAVNLTGVPEGAHAWHIHTGACGVQSPPVAVAFSADKDKPGLTTDLQADASGTVNATVTVPSTTFTVDQLRAADHSLHVHQKGGTDHGPSIACADLK